MKLTPEKISKLNPNQIFVFESCTAGTNMGHGTAHDALVLFGAQYGTGMGRTGQCYAFPTKDDRMAELPPIAIRIQAREFLRYVKKHPELEFLVTKIGVESESYPDTGIGPFLFLDGVPPPPNVRLPVEFWRAAGLF